MKIQSFNGPKMQGGWAALIGTVAAAFMKSKSEKDKTKAEEKGTETSIQSTIYRTAAERDLARQQDAAQARENERSFKRQLYLNRLARQDTLSDRRRVEDRVGAFAKFWKGPQADRPQLTDPGTLTAPQYTDVTGPETTGEWDRSGDWLNDAQAGNVGQSGTITNLLKLRGGP